MVRLNTKLDSTKTGREAEQLEGNLKKLVVGQDEAVEQIVNIYQMHLTGMNAPGRPMARSCSSAQPVPARHELSKRQPSAW